MIIIPDKTGKFPFRIWYDDGEIDHVMDWHLQQFSKLVEPITTTWTPIDKFVEYYLPKALGVDVDLDFGADLQPNEGADVLAATHFFPDKVEIAIDRRLVEESEREGREGRFNITMAHEASHCLFHLPLFRTDANQGVLFQNGSQGKIRCLSRNVASTYDRQWWEYQANQGMAALAMPKNKFLKAFLSEREAYGIYDNTSLLEAEGGYVFGLVAGHLSRSFRVSKKAVGVRLSSLGQLPNQNQQSLLRGGKIMRIGDILGEMFPDW